jgi:hypothetical protein
MPVVEWLEAPEDVLEAVDALLCYLAPGRRRCRNVSKLKRRPLYPLAIERAQRLLHVCLSGPQHEGLRYWYLDKKWSERLKSAGIDSDSLEVIDERRWRHAWDQLKTENTFRISDQQRKISLGTEPPPLAVLHRHGYLKSREQRVEENLAKENQEIGLINGQYWKNAIQKKLSSHG